MAVAVADTETRAATAVIHSVAETWVEEVVEEEAAEGDTKKNSVTLPHGKQHHNYSNILPICYFLKRKANKQKQKQQFT